jgi:hypothetical protein
VRRRRRHAASGQPEPQAPEDETERLRLAQETHRLLRYVYGDAVRSSVTVPPPPEMATASRRQWSGNRAS